MGPAFQPEGPPQDWYADPVWAQVHPGGRTVAGGPAVRVRVRGMPALITAPWALHVGKGSTDLEAWSVAREPWVVVDAPPLLPVPEVRPAGGWFLPRHTRMLEVHPEGAAASISATRRKQVNRAARMGIVVEENVPWADVVRLHAGARDRKGLAADAAALGRLFAALSQSPWAKTWGTRDAHGRWVAAVMCLQEQSRWVYAFGGAERGDRSGVATVALLAAAIDAAAASGATWFDFGGSADPGVDRFYAEFGAMAVPKWRWVRSAAWALPWMRMFRPDLVRGGQPRPHI